MDSLEIVISEADAWVGTYRIATWQNRHSLPGTPISAVALELIFDAVGFDVSQGIPTNVWLVPDHGHGVIRFDKNATPWSGGTISIWRPPAPIQRRSAGRWISIELDSREWDYWIRIGVQDGIPYRVDYWEHQRRIKAGQNRKAK